MQNLTEETNTELLSADELLNLTISEQEKFERDRQSVLENLMSSMVQVATQNGATQYAAALNPQFDKNLLTVVAIELTNLGYRTETTEVNDPKLGTYSNLSISWKKTVEEVVEAAVDTETN